MSGLAVYFMRMKKRPYIPLFILISTLIITVLEHKSPIVEKYGSFKLIFSKDIMDSLGELSHKVETFIAEPKNAIVQILLYLLFALAVSAVISFFTSIYIRKFYLAVSDAEVIKGEFLHNSLGTFVKTIFYFFAIFVSAPILLLLLVFSIAIVYITILVFFSGKASWIVALVVLALLTIAVGFFAFVFYVVYFSYTQPAIAAFRKGGFRTALSMTGGYCWYLMPKTILYLFVMLVVRVVLLAIHYGLASPTMALIVIGITWIIRFIVYVIYTYFIYTSFVAIKDDMFSEE
ncbi:MAG: hypothetical protein E7385_05715 [Ruminococcaceae bacterium]|nr:hypothetical protein [Oscillospiraceae bacterium]